MISSTLFLLASGGTAPPSGFDNFWAIVSKPDNIPIVFMLFIFGFFTWWSLKMGLANDKLIEQGRKDEVLRKMQE